MLALLLVVAFTFTATTVSNYWDSPFAVALLPLHGTLLISCLVGARFYAAKRGLSTVGPGHPMLRDTGKRVAIFVAVSAAAFALAWIRPLWALLLIGAFTALLWLPVGLGRVNYEDDPPVDEPTTSG
jgi:hypothetical protein